jgi:hypothetical protein
MKVGMPRVGIAFSGGPTPGEIVDCVKLAERLGYESAWVAEGHGGDQFAVLAACAIQTSRILLRTSITSVFVDDPLDASGVHPEAYPAALEGARAILVERFAEDATLIGTAVTRAGRLSSSPRFSRSRRGSVPRLSSFRQGSCASATAVDDL